MVDSSARDQYLQAMGIRQWFPRRPLPGARVSPALSAASTVPAAEKQFDDKVIPELKDKNQLLEKQDLQAFGQAVNTQPKNAEPVRVKVSAPPRFRLQGLLFAGHCLVINDTTTEFDSARQADPMRLLMGLLSALAIPSIAQPVVSNFSWPLVRSNHIDQSAGVAKDAALAFIKKQLTGQDISVLILMGDNAKQFILPQVDTSSSANFLEGYQVLVTKSLFDMLTSPLCKRKVWSDLQCLQSS